MAEVTVSECEVDAAAPLTPALQTQLLRTLVGNEPFTIVSNNCWGAHIYQALGLPYATPFVGLFVPPESYLSLLGDFESLMESDLIFVKESRSTKVNEWRERQQLTYPIAMLGGEVEIDFQHYLDEDAALTAWRWRTARMVTDPARLFFKFDDREGATRADLAAFQWFGWPNKLCFAAQPRGSAIVVPVVPGEDHAPDGAILATISRRYFNTLRWISTWPARIPLPSLI
jgi:uncharacterized protein (DUF1919 family)